MYSQSYDFLETIPELEKQIASRRIITPALRNQETASELSDINDGNSKPKATVNFEINPVVDQQLEQLRAKLAVRFKGIIFLKLLLRLS